jgi:histidine triad (HIT) family protein
MSCLFCNILAKKIPADVVYEDEHVLAFRDIRPVAPTHVLVIPREHIAYTHELEAKHAATMGHVMLATRRVAEQLGIAETGYRLVINDGAAACQTVFHIHVHVLGGRSFTWPPG